MGVRVRAGIADGTTRHHRTSPPRGRRRLPRRRRPSTPSPRAATGARPRPSSAAPHRHRGRPLRGRQGHRRPRPGAGPPWRVSSGPSDSACRTATAYNAAGLFSLRSVRPTSSCPGLERWRSYSTASTPARRRPQRRQARKLQYAHDQLGLRPGMRVSTWAAAGDAFVETRVAKAFVVEAITLSRAQHGFVRELIAPRRLPCSGRAGRLPDLSPAEPLRRRRLHGQRRARPGLSAGVADFLGRHLTATGRVYAASARNGAASQVGNLPPAKHLWPGPVGLRRPGHASSVRFTSADFVIHEIGDDTRSYAYTVRVWARGSSATRASSRRSSASPRCAPSSSSSGRRTTSS